VNEMEVESHWVEVAECETVEHELTLPQTLGEIESVGEML